MSTKAMNPDKAGTLKVVDKCIKEWKSTFRYLQEVGEATLESGQLIAILTGMFPLALSGHLINTTDDFKDLDGDLNLEKCEAEMQALPLWLKPQKEGGAIKAVQEEAWQEKA